MFSFIKESFVNYIEKSMQNNVQEEYQAVVGALAKSSVLIADEDVNSAAHLNHSILVKRHAELLELIIK